MQGGRRRGHHLLGGSKKEGRLQKGWRRSGQAVLKRKTREGNKLSRLISKSVWSTVSSAVDPIGKIRTEK